jgi:hypothetical protein
MGSRMRLIVVAKRKILPLPIKKPHHPIHSQSYACQMVKISFSLEAYFK